MLPPPPPAGSTKCVVTEILLICLFWCSYVLYYFWKVLLMFKSPMAPRNLCTHAKLFCPVLELLHVLLCFVLLQGENLIVAVDDDGCFIAKITDFSGQYVKDADKYIIEAVKVWFL